MNQSQHILARGKLGSLRGLRAFELLILGERPKTGVPGFPFCGKIGPIGEFRSGCVKQSTDNKNTLKFLESRPRFLGSGKDVIDELPRPACVGRSQSSADRQL